MESLEEVYLKRYRKSSPKYENVFNDRKSKDILIDTFIESSIINDIKKI